MTFTETLRTTAAPLCAALLIAACTGEATTPAVLAATCAATDTITGQFVTLGSGSFVKGAGLVYAEEAPTLRLQVEPFSIQAHEVTNAQFAAFIEATDYVTDSESGTLAGRPGDGSAVFVPPERRAENAPHWTLVSGATWRAPDGPGSTLNGRDHHPVVHISQRDAKAYAAWAGGRLPSEVEWEYAASLGLPDKGDPRSGAYDGTRPRANVWQGIFPLSDSGADGYSGTAPVGCFEADKAGLHDMIGNVWEWTDTPFGAGTHTIKGGSFLCTDNFCARYRPAARQPQDTDFSASHIGFRIARDVGG